MPTGQTQLELDDLVSAAVIEAEASSKDVAVSATAEPASIRQAVSTSKLAEASAVRTESNEVPAGVLSAATGGATQRGVVRRLDNGLRRIEVLLERARAEQRMADSTAAQAAHEAAKLATRTKVPIAIIAARAGIPVATIAARREVLDQRHRRP